jgi:hypothetical protein
MHGWILLALWTSLNSTAGPSTFKHVRSAEEHVRQLIGEGYARSATFRALVDRVEQQSCVVYISSVVKLSQGMRGALLHTSVGDRGMPVLRVLLKTNLGRDEAIAVIGHELQHVIEAVQGSRGRNSSNLAAVFNGLDPRAHTSNSHKYETEAAIAVAESIRGELKRVPAPRRVSYVRLAAQR